MALLAFYGTECPHCQNMEPLIKRLEEETGHGVERLEVWHDEANAAKLSELDKGLCGGVPFFYNTETKAFICGETSYEELRHWSHNAESK